MREALLRELEDEYCLLRNANEREENNRRNRIRKELPDLERLLRVREDLVFGTLKDALNGQAETANLPEKMEKVSSEISASLVRNGFPPDYLAPIYRCPVCRDTGRTGEPVRDYCSCLKKAYQKKLRERVGLNRGAEETFENFNPELFSTDLIPGEAYSQRLLMEMVRDDCREWADHYPDCRYRDLLLTGQSGLGKTFLLRAMAERLIERDVNVLIISAYRLIEILRKQYFENDPRSGELMEADVLMIDDLGSEPLMQNVTVEQLFYLINERQSRNLATVISTNLNLTRLRERYTERIASRLTDTRKCRVMTLKGKDIRTEGVL